MTAVCWNKIPSLNLGLSAYTTAIFNVPMLTYEEELAAAAALPSEEAKLKLIIPHLRLAYSIVRKSYAGRFGADDHTVKDYLQEANIALIKAVDNYDASKGRFSSFAALYIQYAIVQYSLHNDYPIVITKSKDEKKVVYNINRFKSANKFYGDLLDRVQAEQLAKEINVEPQLVLDVQSRMNGLINSFSLDSVNDSRSDEEKEPLQLPDPTQEPSRIFENSEEEFVLSYGVQYALEALDERSRNIVELRHVKLNEEERGLTLHECAAIYQVSAERIRQIEVAAFKKMKKFLEQSEVTYIDSTRWK